MFNILATFEGHPEMAQFSSVSLSLIGSIPLIVALIFLTIKWREVTLYYKG